MNIKQKIVVIGLCVLFMLSMLLIHGCASTGTVQIKMPVNVNLANYKKIAIEVSSDMVDSNKQVSQLKELLTNELRERNLFEIVGESSSADLLLRAKIMGLRQVGTAERLMGGAGKAEGVADVELIDLKTTKPVSKFRAESTLLWGGTKETLDDLAETITECIQENEKIQK